MSRIPKIICSEQSILKQNYLIYIIWTHISEKEKLEVGFWLIRFETNLFRAVNLEHKIQIDLSLSEPSNLMQKDKKEDHDISKTFQSYTDFVAIIIL